MNRNTNMKNNMIKMMNGKLIKCLNIGGQYYLQTRMLSNEDNAEKTISGNSI